MVWRTGLEPASFCFTGRRFRQLSYLHRSNFWSRWGETIPRPSGWKPDALPTELHLRTEKVHQSTIDGLFCIIGSCLEFDPTLLKEQHALIPFHLLLAPVRGFDPRLVDLETTVLAIDTTPVYWSARLESNQRPAAYKTDARH